MIKLARSLALARYLFPELVCACLATNPAHRWFFFLSFKIPLETVVTTIMSPVHLGGIDAMTQVTACSSLSTGLSTSRLVPKTKVTQRVSLAFYLTSVILFFF